MQLANGLAALEQGDSSGIYINPTKQVINLLENCTCPVTSEFPDPTLGKNELTYAIACGDASDRENDIGTLRKVYDEISSFSTFAASYPIHFFCA